MTPLLLDLETVSIDTVSEFLEPVEAPSNYKDPLKIAAYIEEGTKKAIEKAALDPHLCRIIAFGTGEYDGKDSVVLCRDEETEAAALGALAARIQNAAGVVRPLVSFNGFYYDWPVLMVRAAYLGVPFPRLNLDIYRSPHIDLMQRLSFNGAIKEHSQAFFAKRFGYPAVSDVDGSQIAQMVKDGDWAGVEAKNLADLAIMRFIAQKLRLIESAKTVEAVA